ncbi:hypothetical protein [Capillimicrobium parvum]|uniref:Uncharacterized protein n=1 Tax=Capillimicrobium parvum TaxID=2884022 RepID=A0A9E7C0C1_9ACTN|nr:hypothetical protein [Capillimicrobium parvum]UGS35382.1 hypothetical protein DSM104329_01770 [Capillimicrobium parvum]
MTPSSRLPQRRLGSSDISAAGIALSADDVALLDALPGPVGTRY